jgi:hypothetical protein
MTCNLTTNERNTNKVRDAEIVLGENVSILFCQPVAGVHGFSPTLRIWENRNSHQAFHGVFTKRSKQMTAWYTVLSVLKRKGNLF